MGPTLINALLPFSLLSPGFAPAHLGQEHSLGPLGGLYSECLLISGLPVHPLALKALCLFSITKAFFCIPRNLLVFTESQPRLPPSRIKHLPCTEYSSLQHAFTIHRTYHLGNGNTGVLTSLHLFSQLRRLGSQDRLVPPEKNFLLNFFFFCLRKICSSISTISDMLPAFHFYQYWPQASNEIFL